MTRLICKQARRKDGDARGRIICKVSGLICAHCYWCEIKGCYTQMDSAKNCPGKDGTNGTSNQISSV